MPTFDVPLRRNTIPKTVRGLGYQMREERRKPTLPGYYVYVGDFDTLTPPVATWQSPVWQNSFTWSGTSYFGFRHGLDGATEFVGALDLTAGAVTGTVAFHLPTEYQTVFDPRIFPIDLGAGLWTAGILRMDTVGTYGDIIIEWPIQATPI